MQAFLSATAAFPPIIISYPIVSYYISPGPPHANSKKQQTTCHSGYSRPRADLTARRQADDTLVNCDSFFARLFASLCDTAPCPPVSSFIWITFQLTKQTCHLSAKREALTSSALHFQRKQQHCRQKPFLRCWHSFWALFTRQVGEYVFMQAHTHTHTHKLT